MRPHFGQIERVIAVGFRLGERHDLHIERPARKIAFLDREVEIARMVVDIFPGKGIGLFLRQELDALVGVKMIFHPEFLALGVHPHIGVAGVAVHMAPGFRDAAIAHQPGDLMRRFRRQRPEVPLHIVIAQVVVGAALLRADKVLELHRIANKEDRRVVAHHVVVAFGGVELQGETARIAPGIGAAAFARHG